MIEILTDNNYDELMKVDKNIFIDIFSPGCEPCMTLKKKIIPAMNKYIENNNLSDNIVIYTANTIHNSRLTKALEVRSVPLTIMVNKKKMFSDANLGLAGQAYYISLVDKYSEKKGFFARLFS